MTPIKYSFAKAALVFLLLGVSKTPALADGCKMITLLETHSAEKIEAMGANCSTFLSQTNSTGISCFWEFEFRNQSAIQKAETFWQIIKTCRPGHPLEPDLEVNHPDSYALREWVSTDGIFGVSVKDKTQLEKTLVFLRYEKNS